VLGARCSAREGAGCLKGGSVAALCPGAAREVPGLRARQAAGHAGVTVAAPLAASAFTAGAGLLGPNKRGLAGGAAKHRRTAGSGSSGSVARRGSVRCARYPADVENQCPVSNLSQQLHHLPRAQA